MRGSRAIAAAILGVLALMAPAGAQAPSIGPQSPTGRQSSIGLQPSIDPQPPTWLPRYDLNIHLDTNERLVRVGQRVSWTNRTHRPTDELVFNAHAHYAIPDSDIGLLAKTVELLRMAPSEAMTNEGAALEVKAVALSPTPNNGVIVAGMRGLDHHYKSDNATALVVKLPREIGIGESVTVDLAFTVKLPARKGRWGQWEGVTTLAQWLPVLAVYDEAGWHPVPFVPWHQPFFNEAGIYNVRLVLPADHKVASTGRIQQAKKLKDGWQELYIETTAARDFSLVCSQRFQEYAGRAGEVEIRVLALPEHETYAQEIVKIVGEALPVYERWFGKLPYPQITVVEAYFGWNGNECGDMIMIDERIFHFPKAARAYVDYLVTHELCHQWWYNVVGTNGYAETWMDEGLATYFSHRLINGKLGKNNGLIQWPRALSWLPAIHREDFRNYGMIGVMARGEAKPTVTGRMEDFGHLVNLSAMTYDRGSKVVGMIEERLGETSFFDFMRQIYRKYRFKILRVADFQKELEAYTGWSWEEFFQNWLYSTRTCDWTVQSVQIDGICYPRAVRWPRRGRNQNVHVVVRLEQRGQANEPTVLGFSFKHGDGYPVRIPVHPGAEELKLDELSAKVTTALGAGGQGASAVVDIRLPHEPVQISVDPDSILIDRAPSNNHWQPQARLRLTPLYTQLEDADVSNSYDRWNVIAGPWVWLSSFSDPWYTRSPLVGLRVGGFRTQEFSGGAFVAYRTNDRNVIAGADFVFDHFPLPRTQVGFNFEHSLAALSTEEQACTRGVLYGRYILTYGSSLYMPPFEYAEVFANVQNRCMPATRNPVPGADPFLERYGLGVHYHKNMLTPYWDAEGGYAFDLTYQGGVPIFRGQEFHQVYGQIATVKYTPDPFGILKETPWLNWLAESRWAFRLFGAAGLPERGLFFSLGGGDYFRGFGLQERQGSIVWIGSVEWRIPIARRLTWDCLDHFIGVRNIYFVPFYDVGDAWVLGRSVGPVAHAVGAGLRIDLTWLGLIERTMIRFDVAQAIRSDSPVQFWFGIQHPF